jgi:hypothetical protein
MSNDRYTLHHGFFTSLGILLIVGATFRSCVPSSARTAYVSPPPTQPVTQVPTAPISRKAKPDPEAATEVQLPKGETPPEPVKKYVLTPVSPTTDTAGLGYNISVKQCYRAGEHIECWGLMTNSTDAAERPRLWGGTAFDDEGNSVSLDYVGCFAFSTGSDVQRLLPGIPAKFFIKINDPHLNAKMLALDVHLQWSDYGARDEHLMFKDIPVQ